MVEKQTSKQVKCLRTNNGLEFNNFCKEHGIKRQRSVRYTPQQNGVAERLNRTIMDRVRCQMSNGLILEKNWFIFLVYMILESMFEVYSILVLVENSE